MKNLQGLDESYLSSVSEKDSRFDDHKLSADKISELYGHVSEDGLLGFMCGSRLVSFQAYADKISMCGNYLYFKQKQAGLKLDRANFCKVPHCPMCQWRRSLKWRAKFLKILPEVQELYPTHRWIFLTLTIKNCELDSLRETIRLLNQAFNRLSKRAKFPMDGYVKSIEVTRAWDCYDGFTGEFLGRHGTKWVYQYQKEHNTAIRVEPTTEVHPHLHVVGLVPSSYFGGKYYIKHSEWRELWRQSLRVEYDPMVNIKTVKCRKNKKLIPTPEEFSNDEKSDDSGMIAAICETLKYTVKEQDMIGEGCDDDDANSTWLKKITEQLYKSRKVEYRGVLKEIGKRLEEEASDDDLIHINNDADQDIDIEDDENCPTVIYRWEKAIGRYVFRA